MPETVRSDRTVYLVGSGIASLAGAVFLIRDAGFPGKNIHILEQDDLVGGSLDGMQVASDAYLIRGGRMHEKHYVCYWDLLSGIPSRTDPALSVTEESLAFSRKHVTHAKARLLREGRIVDVSSFGLSRQHLRQLLQLVLSSEAKLGAVRIADWFAPDFFQTNFWLLWTTMFAFQRCSSVMEMRRYCVRFMHLLPGMGHLEGILRTTCNQYDSVVVPLREWLETKGVRFHLNSRVTDIEFEISGEQKTVTAIQVVSEQQSRDIRVRTDDYVMITNGCISACSDVGSMVAPPRLQDKSLSGAWTLWEKIARRHSDFGRPEVFCSQVDLHKWESFTVTLRDPTFFRHMENFTGNTAGTGGLVTMTDSNWLMSVVLAAQPHFVDQPEGVQVFWGYGLYPDRPGNFVSRTMSQCTGAEILTELFGHLRITAEMLPLVRAGKVTCLPVMMPFVDSAFMPRTVGDRPCVQPPGAINFAFVGQFVEIPEDCVFTVEYSVRSAMIAVYQHFCRNRKIPPVYLGGHQIGALCRAAKALSGSLLRRRAVPTVPPVE